MKTYALDLSEALTRGLAPEADTPTGAPYLETCRGLRCTPGGARPHETVTALSGPTATWPFPQFARLGHEYLAFTSTGLYRFGSPDPVLVASSLPGTGRWDTASWAEAWMAVRPGGMLQRGLTLENTTSGANACMADARGSLLIGGFSGSYYAGARWDEAWELWRQHAPAPELVGSWSPASALNTVFWSVGAGGDNESPWLLEGSLFGFGEDLEFEAFRSEYIDRIARGDIGFLVLPGAVYGLAPLGNDAVAHTTAGAFLLRSLVGDDGIMRYTSVPWADVRVGRRGHVIEGGGVQYVIDDQDALWAGSADQGMRRLGYSQWLENLGDTVALSWDGAENEVYLCGETVGYVFGEGGLSELDGLLWDAQRRADGSLAGWVSEAAAEFEVATWPTAMRGGWIKHMQAVEMDAVDVTGFEGCGEFRFGNEAWRASKWVRADAGGVVYPAVSGRVFRARFRGTATEGMNCEHIGIKWQRSDSRSVRGALAQAGGAADGE